MVYYISKRMKDGVSMVEDTRRKRVQRLKKMIVVTVIILLIAPSLFCVFLTVKVGRLERQLQQLKDNSHKSLEIIWEQERTEEDTDSAQKEEETSETSEVQEEEELRKVYLTFDDGPSIYTEEILDILKRYNVKATFFVTGMNMPQYEDCLQKILDDGHSLGIHTYSHVYKDIYDSLESFQEDYGQMKDYIYQCTGTETKLYRFPGGSGNQIVSKEIRQEILKWLEEEEIAYFDWNVSGKDAEGQTLSAQQIAENCLEGVKKHDTAVVLLHDAGGKKSTVEALPLIIEGINRLGDTVLLPMDEQSATFQQVKLTEE